MNFIQLNKPSKLNMDISRKYLSQEDAWMLFNCDALSKQGKLPPIPANFSMCDMEMPAGENYRVGSHHSPLTNESYAWVYNGNNNHFIYRVAADGCQVVAYDDCIQLSAEPQHEITDFRAWMRLDKNVCNTHGKYLVWVNGLNDIGMIDVEASIATNFFTTPYFDMCLNRCDLYKLCVPKSCECIQAEWVPLPQSERGLSNHMLDKSFKYMFQHIYYDGRRSEWSDRSTLYYQDVKGCFDTSEGFPRCQRLRIPLGSPLVDRIAVAYSTDGITWQLSDTIEKYKKYNDSQQKWYERHLSEDIDISEDGCYLYYNFCNDKQCHVIDPAEVSRVFNSIPIAPQGLLPVGKSLGFYNYIKGMCPIDRAESEKFKVELTCSESPECETEFVTIKVRAVIHNMYHNRNQFVYRLGSGDDEFAETAWFGGLNPSLDGGFETGYDQYFNDKVRGFIVYVDGTEYWAEMKQWKSDKGWRNNKQVGTLSDLDRGSVRNDHRRFTRRGGFYYGEAEIKVKKGTRGYLRLASHHATGNEQDTSTFVEGIIDDIRDYKGDSISAYNNKTEEIQFDTSSTADVVDVYKAFLIMDNAIDTSLVSKAHDYYGYIKDFEGRPIEGSVVKITGGLNQEFHNESITDHNGFFHITVVPTEIGLSSVPPSLTFSVLAEQDCDAFKPIHTFVVSGDYGAATEANENLTEQNTYNNSFYATVKTRVVDCDNVPVGGIRVSLSGSKSQATNSFGEVNIRIRNYRERNRVVNAVVMDTGGCFTYDCSGNCNTQMPRGFTFAPSCFNNTPVVTIADMKVNREAAVSTKRGLKSGGRYGFGFVAEGRCGRLSQVGHTVYVDIPKAQTVGKLRYCMFKYSAKNMVLPDWVDCLKIVRTENINPFELQWIVDEITRTSEGVIKLTIQSLNDYNAGYFFKTNTSYGYTIGDRVEFIKNGDGKYFNTVLNYITLSPFHDKEVSGEEDESADYFNQILIRDDGRLGDLKKGAVIELQRPKSCNTEPEYREICAVIPVADNKPRYDEGVFDTFDTYVVNRQIGANPSQQFEHHSPSDFWGTSVDTSGAIRRMDDTGKVHFVDKYATEKRMGRSISLNAPNVFNRFGDVEKTFDAPEQGDIVAMGIKDGKIILGICQHDNFMAQSADDLLRVGGDGIIRALPADSVISDTQPKLSGRFGCDYESVGSVYFGDTYACWVDVKNKAFVQHNYDQAKDVSENKAKSFISRRCQEVEKSVKLSTHPLNTMRFAVGRNFYNGAIMLTIRSLRSRGFVNSPDPYSTECNTILYNPKNGDWLTFVGFVPEGYSYISLPTDEGCAFITYFHGVPYCHPISTDVFNEFYGVQCDKWVGISLNKEPTKIKKPISFELQGNMRYFVEKVTLENGNFISEIAPAMIDRDGDKFNGAFLANKNSPGGLFGDDLAESYVVDVLFCRDNTRLLQYKTFDNAKRILHDELDIVIFKFSMRESSGFTENI